MIVEVEVKDCPNEILKKYPALSYGQNHQKRYLLLKYTESIQTLKSSLLDILTDRKVCPKVN